MISDGFTEDEAYQAFVMSMNDDIQSPQSQQSYFYAYLNDFEAGQT